MVDKKNPKKKRTNKKTEKTNEIFEIESAGKEKLINKKFNEEVDVENPGQSKHQSSVLKILLIVLGVVILLILGIFYYIDTLRYSNYKGVEFKTIASGDLIFYQTSVPVQYQGKIVPYNVYLRTKINKLKNIPFDDEGYGLMKFAVLNVSDTFDCNDGDEVIAIANLKNVHDALGIQLMKDENATCDPEGRYSYYNVIASNDTMIEKIGDKCYNIHVSDCEILPATERLIIEMLYDYNTKLSK